MYRAVDYWRERYVVRDARCKDLDRELRRVRAELERWKGQCLLAVSTGGHSPPVYVEKGSLGCDALGKI